MLKPESNPVAGIGASLPSGSVDAHLTELLSHATPRVFALDYGPAFRGRSRYTALGVAPRMIADLGPGATADELFRTLATLGRAGGTTGGFGFLSYDVKHMIEPVAGHVHRVHHPLLRFVRYDDLVVVDHAREPDGVSSSAMITESAPHRRITLAECAELSAADYTDRIRAIQCDIEAGEYYELNFTQRFRLRSSAPPGLVALRLRLTAAAPYWAFMDFGDLAIISASPELFIRRRGDHLETRPIKGSARRGSDRLADSALIEHLRNDPKNQAEHTMVVDLSRNDLGRISEFGTVHTTEHSVVETYPAVHHLVSTVVGQARSGIGLSEVVQAAFPPASITGAPKIRVMQAIDQYEISPRGIYTGAIGRIAPTGDLDLNVAIRTIIARSLSDGGYEYEFGAGGAIVADSDPLAEYEECLLKAGPLLDAILAVEK